jgi:hypothetical protein
MEAVLRAGSWAVQKRYATMMCWHGRDVVEKDYREDSRDSFWDYRRLRSVEDVTMDA